MEKFPMSESDIVFEARDVYPSYNNSRCVYIYIFICLLDYP